jgi:hypothetical protein
MKSVYLKIEETDFKKLVEGQVVVKDKDGVQVNILLSDIGFDRIFIAVDKAYEKYRKTAQV